MPERIHLIEDNDKVAGPIIQGLKDAGFDVVRSATGAEAETRLEKEEFDLILLDLGLPDADGLDILKFIRQRNIDVVVIILTARDNVDQRVEGLETGADDYVRKPFSFNELHARINAFLRRANQTAKLNAAGYQINLVERSVVREDKSYALTPKEFDLLALLARNKNDVVTREIIVREVWKENNQKISMDNLVDVHISRLRDKLFRDGKDFLKTVRGVGFVLKDTN